VLWEECGDPMEPPPAGGAPVAQRQGDPVLKNFVAAVKAKNAAVKYIGYVKLPVHSTASLGAPVTPAGLIDFERQESFFIHQDGTDPRNRANRVKYVDRSSDIYDVTNPAWRQAMADKLKASLDYHQMDGLVLDACFDLPEVSGAGPSANIITAWQQGCVDTEAVLKRTMPDKLILPTGFKHLGTQSQPETVNGPAAFNFMAQRVDVTDGFYWEDPMALLLTAQPSNQVYIGTITRYQQVQSYIVQRGKYLANAVNTNAQGQSSFATTNRSQQLQLERFYLAAHLTQFANEKTLMHLWTPTGLAVGETFVSDAFFKDWDYNIGAPTAAAAQPAGADIPIYQREFERGRAVLNASDRPFTVNLADKPFKTLDGQAVTSFSVPAKSGMLFLADGADPVPVVTPTPTAPPEQVACSPRPAVKTTVTNLGNNRFQVDLTTSTGGGFLRSIQMDQPRNATVDYQGGAQGVTSATTFQPANGATTARLFLNRTPGTSAFVQMTVTDGCGTWKTFAGAGLGVS
jgi:hypothetical protein